MSLIEKIKGRKEILHIEEVDYPDIGSGYRADVRIGNTTKVCNLIQDKGTGEWKTLGDPKACQILAKVLSDIGTPLVGKTQGEKITEQPLMG